MIGCNSTGIPITYVIQNIPIVTPLVLFSYSSGTNTVGQCSSELVVSLSQSKGLTKRDILVTWTLLSMTPSDTTT